MLKSLLSHLFQITLGLLLVLTAIPAWGQDVPTDLEVIATAGGLGPDAEYATVRITTDGQGTYHRFQSGDLTSPTLESSTFALNTAEVEQLWQAIQDGDFFNLEAEYAAEDIVDRTYAELNITANGSVHTVTTQNIAVEGFDDIISTINALTPGNADLVYDTSEPITFTSLDICEQPGIRGQATLSKQVNKATGEPAVEVITATETHPLSGDAHPGTVVAYRMTLQEAVSRGIVTLNGKGGSTIFGDAVSISINNSSSITSNRLTLSLYLELWGPAASASTSQIVENAIENAWSGKTTTGGQTMTVDVVTRTTPGGTSAPGTKGFHQIKLVTDSSFASNVVGSGFSFDVNEGVGSGTWSTTGSEVNELYAHEAGHLFGLDDRYEDYRKQADGTWRRQSDGQTFTTSSLANELAPSYPEYTLAELLAKLEDGRRRATAPVAGSENDLMATLKGSVQQSDIDALAAQAGLVIEVRPGDILVNKDGSEQNFVLIRSEDVFVPTGGSKTLGGLYVACIDGSRSFPSAGVGFDLAPSMSDWRGIEAAQFLQMLVDHVNEQERFCATSGYVPQAAIWRITNNSNMQDSNVGVFLQAAGINLGDRILDFPHMANPNANEPNTSLVTPLELFVPDLASSTGDILNPGETVTLTGAVHAPVGVVESTVITWSLDTPTGSAATLSSHQGETTFFTTDVRGIYQVLMQAEVTDTLANTFTLETVDLFTAADAYTETFETGIIEPGGPFYWETNEDKPWIVTDRASHSGVFSAASADIGDGETTTLTAKFTQVADGTISFAYKVSSQESSDLLVFSIDGEVQGSWSGRMLDWSTFSIDLAAGTHTASWSYEKDDRFSHSSDRAWIDDVFFPESAIFTSIEEPAGDGLPATYQLSQNYPNPFNPTTTITYAIPQSQHVKLVVYNALGRQVAILVEGRRNPGQYQVQFDARGLSNGVYYYELRAGKFRERKAMVLLR